MKDHFTEDDKKAVLEVLLPDKNTLGKQFKECLINNISELCSP